MELLVSPKSSLLLEAGLEVLHEQSQDWLSEIAFWKDEAAFFYSLIVKKTMISIPVSSKELSERVEKELLDLTSGELDELEKSVREHESHLSDLLESRNPDPKVYREKHRQMTLRFLEFERKFRNIKKDVFSLAETVDKAKERK